MTRVGDMRAGAVAAQGGHVLRQVRNWRKLTQHPQSIQVNPPKQVYPDIRLPRPPGGLA